MNARVLAFALVTAAGLGWLGRGAFSEDVPASPPQAEPSDAEMEKWMEQLAAPGEMHRWLAKASGPWSVSGWFMEMDGKRTPTHGRACFQMLLGGRWQHQVFNGTMGGKPFQGRAMTGFDNDRKVFTNYWFDTMSTSTAPASGTLAADGKTLSLAGEWEMMGQKMPFRYVSTWVDDRTMRFQMHISMDGNEMQAGELVYTRTR